MSSNLYLFDHRKSADELPEKPVVDIMREVEIARAEESARIFRAFATRIAGLFGSRKQSNVTTTVTTPAANPVGTATDEDRLAA
jgi:hypothetical protein